MELDVFIEAITERVVQYLREAEQQGKVTKHSLPASLSRTTDLHLPLEGNGIDSVLDDVDTYLRSCVKTNRAEFMNPLWGGVSPVALAGEIITSLTNTSMYTYELAPLATLIEQTLLKRMGGDCRLSRIRWHTDNGWFKRKHARIIVCSSSYGSLFNSNWNQWTIDGCLCLK